MIPAMLAPFFWIGGNLSSKSTDPLLHVWMIPLYVIAGVLTWAALNNYLAYVSNWATDQYISRRQVDNQTPETILFEHARSMHPEAVRLLLQHRKKIWMIRQAPFDSREWADWVLFDAPEVHVDAVINFLQNSN
jgi:hypothetical protein